MRHSVTLQKNSEKSSILGTVRLNCQKQGGNNDHNEQKAGNSEQGKTMVTAVEHR